MIDKRLQKLKNDIHISIPMNEDIWCCICGDRTCYIEFEQRHVIWKLKDKSRGLGICLTCSMVIEPEQCKLPDPDPPSINPNLH